jgi:hypothetical protein
VRFFSSVNAADFEVDRITPIESGMRINSLMPHSTRIIIQDGPGVRVISLLFLLHALINRITALFDCDPHSVHHEARPGVLCRHSPREWDDLRHVIHVLPWPVIQGRFNFRRTERGGCETAGLRAGCWGTFAGRPSGMMPCRLRSALLICPLVGSTLDVCRFNVT